MAYALPLQEPVLPATVEADGSMRPVPTRRFLVIAATASPQQARRDGFPGNL